MSFLDGKMCDKIKGKLNVIYNEHPPLTIRSAEFNDSSTDEPSVFDEECTGCQLS